MPSSCNWLLFYKARILISLPNKWVHLTLTGPVYAPWIHPGNWILFFYLALLVSKWQVLILYKFEFDIVLEMKFTHWMCNCSLQLLSINMNNDLLISLPLLSSSLPVDWVHGGHGDDAEIQEASVWKRWVNANSSRSTSVLFLSGWCVGNECVSQTHVDPPVLQGYCLLLWHTKGWQQSCLASVAELLLTLSGISHSPPVDIFAIELLHGVSAESR